jgi:hypothetical protein
VSHSRQEAATELPDLGHLAVFYSHNPHEFVRTEIVGPIFDPNFLGVPMENNLPEQIGESALCRARFYELGFAAVAQKPTEMIAFTD